MKKFLYLLFIIVYIAGCNKKNPDNLLSINKHMSEPGKLWQEYLSALKTGDENKIKAASLAGYTFTKTWLDKKDYKNMCIELGKGWSKAEFKITFENNSSAIGTLKVPILTKSYFYFGSSILVYFKKTNNNWKIAYISFEGD